MPYIVVQAWYPPDRVDDVVNVYMQAVEKVPADESITTPVVEAAVTSNKDGIETISISEVKPGKLEEAIDRTNQRMVMFHSVPDYRYESKTWMTVEEALSAVGRG
jgi:hypothetical protein